MNMIFRWAKVGDGFRPACSSGSPRRSAGRLLSNLLIDDGGLGLKTAIDCVGEGVQILESVVSGRVPHAEWDRETWGTNIGADHVEIYFLLQEDYSAYIETAVFHRALVAWLFFLQNGPHGLDGSLNEIVLDL